MKHIILFTVGLIASKRVVGEGSPHASKRVVGGRVVVVVRAQTVNFQLERSRASLSSLRSEAARFYNYRKGKNERRRNRRPGDEKDVIEDLEKSGSGPKSFFRSRHRSTNYEIIVLMDDIELVGYYKDYWTRDISTFVD